VLAGWVAGWASTRAGNPGLDSFQLAFPQSSCVTVEAPLHLVTPQFPNFELGTFVFPYPWQQCENKYTQDQVVLETASAESHASACRYRDIPAEVRPELQSPKLCRSEEWTGSSRKQAFATESLNQVQIPSVTSSRGGDLGLREHFELVSVRTQHGGLLQFYTPVLRILKVFVTLAITKLFPPFCGIGLYPSAQSYLMIFLLQGSLSG